MNLLAHNAIDYQYIMDRCNQMFRTIHQPQSSNLGQTSNSERNSISYTLGREYPVMR